MAPPADPISIQAHSLRYLRSPVPTPLGIAVHLGWLSGELSADGVAIKSLRDLDHAEQHASQSEYTLANSFRQGGSVPVLWARSRGADMRVIGLSWVDESQAIISLPDSGIESVRQLRGRRLGLPSRPTDNIDIFRAVALRGFLNALELEGLTHRDVELVDLTAPPLGASPADASTTAFSHPPSVLSRSQYATEAAALLRGEVDAIYVKGSLGMEVTHLLGAQVVVDIGFHPDPHIRNNNGTPRPLTVNAAVLANYPDIVSGFLRLVVAAGDWAQRNPAETVAYISRETGSASEWVRAAYGERLHHHLGVDLSPASVAALKEFKDFLLEWGFLAQDFDVAAWIDPRPLAEVEAFSARRSA